MGISIGIIVGFVVGGGLIFAVAKGTHSSHQEAMGVMSKQIRELIQLNRQLQNKLVARDLGAYTALESLDDRQPKVPVSMTDEREARIAESRGA